MRDFCTPASSSCIATGDELHRLGCRLECSRPEALAAAEQEIIDRACELRRAGQPLRTIQAAVEADFGRRLSLDALNRIVKVSVG